MPEVSVIIPVFNCEQYLTDAVQSVLCQSFDSFEVILVDDGSTDKSGVICDSFENDFRVRVIHQQNMGLSCARNSGMRAANGKYVCFVDSDDVLSDGALDYCVGVASETGADIVLCGYVMDTVGAEYEISCGDFTINGENAAQYFVMLKQKNLLDTSCNKLYRSDFLKKNNLEFPAGELFEDTDFNLRALKCRPLIAVRSKCFYHYMQRGSGSLTRRYDPRKLPTLKRRATDIMEVGKELGCMDYCAFYYLKSMLSCFIDMYIKNSISARERKSLILAEISRPEYERAVKYANACGKEKIILRVASSCSYWQIALFCRIMYVLKYKMSRLFFRMR